MFKFAFFIFLDIKKASSKNARSLDFTGGEGGIRTHGPFDRTLDFESKFVLFISNHLFSKNLIKPYFI